MSCGVIGQITRALCGTRGTAKDVVRAWYAFQDAVSAIPSPTNHVISGDITLEADEYFHEIGLDKVGSSFAFTPTGEGLSKEYENTAVLFVNGVAPSVSKLTSPMINDYYILIVQDKNGNKWLYGAVGDGAEIAPTATNDRNGYSLAAKWNAPYMPYAYTGAILTEAA
jgi:hypothetical protein